MQTWPGCLRPQDIVQYRILCATLRDRFRVRDLYEKRKASSEQKKTDKEIYDVLKLVGEYKRSSDLHQLRKTAWKLPTLILGSVCERVSSLPRYTVDVVSVYQPKIVLYPFHQTTSSFDPVHYRKALALVINLRRFLLVLRYLLLRKQNYNVVHTQISPIDSSSDQSTHNECSSQLVSYIGKFAKM